MNKTFKELGFKEGDTVKCVDSNYHGYEINKTYTIWQLGSELKTNQGFNGHSGSWELVTDNKEKENGMFIETKTVKTIKEIIDGGFTNSAYVSLVPKVNSEGKVRTVNLVIGSSYEHRCASLFNKKALKALVDSLQEVVDTMEGQG